MSHQMTIERVTNRVWGIFSSLNRGPANDGNCRTRLKAHIGYLVERGEHNADRLTVDGLVFLKELTTHQKKSVMRRA
jgi:hypothetical protein